MPESGLSRPNVMLAMAETTPGPSTDLGEVKQALDLVKRHRPDEATPIAATLRDAVARSLIEWAVLHSDDTKAGFDRYVAFMATHPSWPNIGMFRRRAEAALWQEFKRRVNSFWSAVEPAFAWDDNTRRQQAEDFLHRQVMPRQGDLLNLISQVDQTDQRNLGRSNAKMTELFTRFGNELSLSTLVASLLGGLLGFLTVHRVLTLEQAAGRRLREVTQARSELQELSNRIVTVQEEERRRVARELHDEVGQALSALLVELGRASNRLPPESESRANLSLAREFAERAVAQVRDMALLLRPSMLDDLGLVPALKWQARELARRTGVKVKVAAETVPDDLPDRYRTCIYRVVQEALNNAARHAQASWARVEAVQENGRIRVTIQDNGAGFDPSQEKGMGILGMEERVKGIGGIFRIDSEKGSGTIVSLLIPAGEAALEAHK